MGTASSKPRATITDVAKAAGVSIKTVSRVVNGVTSVNPEMAQRVNAAIDELGYRPNFLASKLKSGASTQTIGFIAKDLSNPSTGRIFAGIEIVARRRSTQVLTASTEESDTSDTDLDIARELVRREIDGLIIMAGGGDYSPLSSAAFAGVPQVFVDREPHNLARDIIVLGNAEGADHAVSRFISQGHKRIAHLYGSMTIPTMRERRLGVDNALRRAGHLRSQAPCIAGMTTRTGAADTTRRLLDSPNPPTAIFCANEEILMGCAREIAFRGREDIALAAFGAQSTADLLPLPITLVEADGLELGRSAANTLYNRIRNPELEPQRVVLPARVRDVRPEARPAG